MKKENFGSIMYDGKIINLETSEISDLERIQENLKQQREELKQKMEVVFKQ